MIDEMIAAAIKAHVGYMECGEPSPPMEWVMSFDAVKKLKTSDAFNRGLLHIVASSGELEFYNHPIRPKHDAEGWELKPVQA